MRHLANPPPLMGGHVSWEFYGSLEWAPWVGEIGVPTQDVSSFGKQWGGQNNR